MIGRSKVPRLQQGLGYIQSASLLCQEAYKRETLYGDDLGVQTLEKAITELLKLKSRYLSIIRDEGGLE